MSESTSWSTSEAADPGDESPETAATNSTPDNAIVLIPRFLLRLLLDNAYEKGRVQGMGDALEGVAEGEMVREQMTKSETPAVGVAESRDAKITKSLREYVVSRLGLEPREDVNIGQIIEAFEMELVGAPSRGYGGKVLDWDEPDDADAALAKCDGDHVVRFRDEEAARHAQLVICERCGMPGEWPGSDNGGELVDFNG